jgi:hypothetical protein
MIDMHHEGDMACPKCKGHKKIVVKHTFDGMDYGLIENCDYCYGTGEVSDPDW